MLLGGRMGKAGPVPFWILAYICLASCVGYGLWNLLLKYHDMSRMSTIKFAETLFSAVFSWTILGENIFRWQYLFSFALVAAGLIISTHSKP